MEINFQRIYTTVRFFVEKKNIIIILQVKNSEEEHLFKMENFCDIINILTVTSDQFNVYLLNKSVDFLRKTPYST